MFECGKAGEEESLTIKTHAKSRAFFICELK